MSYKGEKVYKFFIKFTITYLIALRLQCICLFSGLPYLINSIYMFVLILMYSLNKKRRFWMSLILIIFTLISALSFNSLMSFFFIIIILIVPLIDNYYKKLKFILSLIIISIPFLILYFAQQLNRQEYLNIQFEKMINFFEIFIKNYLTYGSLNFKEFVNKTLLNQYLYEFHLMRDVLEFIIKIKN